ncbi:MAG: PIN domain-containing protein [Caulobacterales bacterium]
MPRVALDTNVLVYAEGIERAPTDSPKVSLSRRLIEALANSAETWVTPTQALAELHSVLVRRRGLHPRLAASRIQRLRDLSAWAPTTAESFDSALELASDHNLQIYDAVILATAAEAQCDLLASEDLQDGFVWRSVTVTNPFGPTPDPRLARLLAGP